MVEGIRLLLFMAGNLRSRVISCSLPSPVDKRSPQKVAAKEGILSLFHFPLFLPSDFPCANSSSLFLLHFTMLGRERTFQSLLWDRSFFPGLRAGPLEGRFGAYKGLGGMEWDRGGRILSRKTYSIFRVT